jgi:hypothetical protein
VGVDCGQLLAGVYIGAGFFKPDEMLLPEYYSLSVAQHKESTEYVEQIMRFMREIPESEVQPGDVVVYKLGLAFAHAAIVVEWPTFVIHAFAHGGVRGASGNKHPRLLKTSRKFFTLKDEFCYADGGMVEPIQTLVGKHPSEAIIEAWKGLDSVIE